MDKLDYNHKSKPIGGTKGSCPIPRSTGPHSSCFRCKAPVSEVGASPSNEVGAPQREILDPFLILTLYPENFFNLASCNLCIGGSRGRARRTPPPTGPNSFVFTYIFTKKRPLRRFTPPYGKS